MTATLTAGGAGVSGRTVTFTLGGASRDATTNASGTATASVSIAGYSVGTFVGAVQAQFAGDATYLAVSATGTLTVTNSAPVATPQTRTLAEDTPLSITLGGFDADADALTFAIVTGPTHGQLAGTAPALTYTPAANYIGADSFVFSVTDSHGATTSATVNITVTAVNDPPVITLTSPMFSLGQALAANTNPVAMAGGDFNGDGRLDVVTAAQTSSDLAVFLSTANGTFAPRTLYSTPSTTRGVAVGDINHDGKLDLVSANISNQSVSVFTGFGDGTFGPAQTTSLSTAPWCVAVADMNGDGWADVVIGSGSTSSVGVMLNTGAGALQTPVMLPAGGQVLSVVLGDMNGDTRPDVVAHIFQAGGNNAVGVFLGNGNGTLQSPLTVTIGQSAATGGLATGISTATGSLTWSLRGTTSLFSTAWAAGTSAAWPVTRHRSPEHQILSRACRPLRISMAMASSTSRWDTPQKSASCVATLPAASPSVPCSHSVHLSTVRLPPTSTATVVLIWPFRTSAPASSGNSSGTRLEIFRRSHTSNTRSLLRSIPLLW